jgi:UDP-N-acetylglucosamine acyltransferase
MNKIHPTAIIGPEVELGTGNAVGPYTVIYGSCLIGDNNWIGPHVVIGTPGEIRGRDHHVPWDGESSAGSVVIGDRNVIREFVTVQQSEAGETRIGNGCYIMNKSYVPHDAVIGDEVTISAAVAIAGHSIIGDKANLGLGAIVHQKLIIGSGAMIGMGSVVTRHIPPFALAYGSPARVRGPNTVGLRRLGFTEDNLDIALAAFEPLNLELLRKLFPEQMSSYETCVEQFEH